jgi:cytochrome P450
MVGASIPGELLLDGTVLDEPNTLYERLTIEAPVWHVADTDLYTINSYEAVTEAAKRVEVFSSELKYLLYRDARGLPAREPHFAGSVQILATADPPIHAQHKRVIMPSFTPGRVAALEGAVRRATDAQLVQALREGRMEFMGALANRVPIDIVTDLVGFSHRSTDALLKMAMVQTDMLAAAFPREALLEKLSSASETHSWIVAQLQAALQTPGEGILGDLARGVRAGEIEVMVAIAILATLFAAGGESTSSLIGNSVHALAVNPDLQARLRANPRLIPTFLEEVLRLESPFRHHMRLVKQSTELCGTKIPEGATALLMWGAANRDPAMFDRPETIDLDRPRRHVAFGHGVHTCIGNALARLEARVILETLLASTERFGVDPADPPSQVRSLAVRRFARLPLLLTAD